MTAFYNFKKQTLFVTTVLIVCNIIPTCAGYKAEITRSFAMPIYNTSPLIIDFSPKVGSNKEPVLVNVQGVGFTSESQLIINGFIVGAKYINIINDKSAVVKVPKGIPAGIYSAVIKNSNGKASNEVWFEITS